MNQVSRRSFAEPTSLRLTGRAPCEESLLAIGIRYQERTGFHRLRPPGL